MFVLFDLLSGYNRVVTIPAGATNILVTQNGLDKSKDDDNYLGVLLFVASPSFLYTRNTGFIGYPSIGQTNLKYFNHFIFKKIFILKYE